MAQKNATNTPMFSYAEVINIICRIAPNATARDIRNAIEAETQTARDNAPQSETRETAPTPSTATNPSPANKKTAPAKKQPKKKADLAGAYAKIQAYATYNGKKQIDIYEEAFSNTETGECDAFVVLTRAEGVSDRKWNAISLSLRKAIEALSGERDELGDISFDADVWAKAMKAAQKSAKKAAK